MTTIATVLKSGGDFHPIDVQRLFRSISRHVTRPYTFVCLTDEVERVSAEACLPEWNDRCRILPLSHDLPGWWSKIELFRLQGPLIALDLDTAVVGSLDPLVDHVATLGGATLMLRDFYHGGWASGVMGWAGDMGWVLSLFLGSAAHGRYRPRMGSASLEVNGRVYGGDQVWLEYTFAEGGQEVVAAQDVFPGIYSYKQHIRQIRGQPLPPGAAVICFHGSPRPADVVNAIGWLQEAWAVPV